MPPLDTNAADYTDTSGAPLVAAGDLITAGALQAIRAPGWHVSDDVPVAGLGGFHIAEHVQPALVMVGPPLFELGMRAAFLLSEQMSGVSRQQVVTFATQQVERGSFAGPRSVN